MIRLYMPYRSRDEIRCELLSAIKEYEPRGIFRTRLMMLGNVTNLQLHSYIQEMLTNGLVTCDTSRARHVAASSRRGVSKTGDRFHITEKGLRYLQMAEAMKESMGGIKI